MNVQDAAAPATSDLRVVARRFPYSPSVIPGAIKAMELIMIALSAAIAYWGLGIMADDNSNYYIVSVIFIGFIHAALANMSGLHAISAVMRPMGRADDVFITVVTAFLLLMSIIYGFKVNDDLSMIWMGAFAALSFVSITIGRFSACQILRYLSTRRMIGRSLVVLGVGEQSRRFLRRLAASDAYFVGLTGVFDVAPTTLAAVEGAPVLGDVEALLECARQGKIDDVVVAMPWNADRQLTEAIETLKELPVNVYLSTDLIGFELTFKPVMGDLSALPMFEVVQRPISGWSSALKAIEDYALSILILVLISPLLAFIAIAIKIDSPGPIFFKQKRLGFNNNKFEIYKFRSMYHQEIPESVIRQASKADPRITRVGKFIRATSLDELPQLLNVLNGTMSIVGPRPHALSHNEEYGRKIRGYFARHRVKPGITGWAQVNGLRGETETIDKMEARIRHDVYYAENWSILFDIRIIVMTALVFLFQKSAY